MTRHEFIEGWLAGLTEIRATTPDGEVEMGRVMSVTAGIYDADDIVTVTGDGSDDCCMVVFQVLGEDPTSCDSIREASVSQMEWIRS